MRSLTAAVPIPAVVELLIAAISRADSNSRWMLSQQSTTPEQRKGHLETRFSRARCGRGAFPSPGVPVEAIACYAHFRKNICVAPHAIETQAATGDLMEIDEISSIMVRDAMQATALTGVLKLNLQKKQNDCTDRVRELEGALEAAKAAQQAVPGVFQLSNSGIDR